MVNLTLTLDTPVIDSITNGYELSDYILNFYRITRKVVNSLLLSLLVHCFPQSKKSLICCKSMDNKWRIIFRFFYIHFNIVAMLIICYNVD